MIFVLGAPLPAQRGARLWASSTPNILNVAITRAQENLYVVGYRSVWTEGCFGALAAATTVGPVVAEPVRDVETSHECIVSRFEELFDQENDWLKVARYLESRALDDGIHLPSEDSSPRQWARNVIEAIRYQAAGLDQYTPGDLDHVETAEELYWHLVH